MFNKKTYKKNVKFFLKKHEASYEILTGTCPVMISAPHSVSQTRNGKRKPAEPYTGALAKMLHDELSCSVIYKTRNLKDDANYDKNSPYKNDLAKYVQQNRIKFVIDLHQLSDSRNVMIDIGTNYMKNLNNALKPLNMLNIILEAFSKRNLGILQIDKPFAASGEYTVSAFISSSCRIPCVQLEINSGLLRPAFFNIKVRKVYEALVEIIQNLPLSFKNR